MIERDKLARYTIPSCRRAFWLLGVCPLLATPLQAVHLRGQIVRVGYSGSSTDVYVAQGDMYRIGRWTPVFVELSNDDGDLFEGTIEVRQTDADGDEVLARQEVAVRNMRPFCLYVPGGVPPEDSFARGMGYEGPEPFSLRVFDRDGRLAQLHDDAGEPVQYLSPPRPVVPAPPDALLVLDMSAAPVGQLSRVKELERVQECIVLRCSPRDMPGHAAGLEMLDILVWDSPEPSSLDMQQVEAVIEWVHRGGRLVVGASRRWDSLVQSKLGPLLPGRLNGTATITDLDALGELMRGADRFEVEQSRAALSLTYCPLVRENLASDALAVRPRGARANEQIWIARRPCGRGEITLVTGELRDVLSLNPGLLAGDALLRLKSVPEPQGQMITLGPTTDVFSRVAAQTAFQTTSGLYFTFAFAFVVGYIVVVTGGVWGWLRRHRAIRHAWLASGLLAAAASGVSLAAVQIVRSWGQGVHEMTIVDGQIGNYDATALSYLGFRTGSHMLLDVCVPGEWIKAADLPEMRASLRPHAPEAPSGPQHKFSVSQRYESVAQLGELRGVPFRATLKQFSATWRGSLDGRITASLRTTSSGDELAPSSWIENQLGIDLWDCYLFTRSSRTGLVHVYAITSLPAGQRIDVGQIAREMQARQGGDTAGLRRLRDSVESLMSDEESDDWSPPVLRSMLAQCLRDLAIDSTRAAEERRSDQPLLRGGAAPYVPALLLLTFFDDRELSGLLQQGQELARSHGRELEMSSRLEPGTALFVGFSDRPGPLRLCRRKPGGPVDAWKPMLPSRSAVMYRFRAAVQ